MTQRRAGREGHAEGGRAAWRHSGVGCLGRHRGLGGGTAWGGEGAGAPKGSLSLDLGKYPQPHTQH